MKQRSFFPMMIVVCGFSLQGVIAENESPLSYRHITVLERDGIIASVTPVPEKNPPPWARKISSAKADWNSGPRSNRPYFEAPVPFVLAPTEAGEPFFEHNHQPAITWLDNGDLLAIWYTTGDEKSTELTVLASRLRKGSAEWDPSSAFFKANGHNMHSSSLLREDDGTIYHFNGMAPEGAKGWDRLALMMRASKDNGVTWTPPRLIGPEFKKRRQAIAGPIFTRGGLMIQNCDAVPGMRGGTALLISADKGQSWTDPGDEKPAPQFIEGGSGEGTIAGIHAGIVELKDDRLMALGRDNNISGGMPRSISTDLGKTWTYHATSLPPIRGGQRLVLQRLREGPLLLVSFTSPDRSKPRANGLEFVDEKGGSFTGYGMFASLSYDEGETWPIRRLISPGSGDYDGGAWTGKFTAAADNAEHAGYLAATQTPDSVIHLISSRLHYRFNLAWITEYPSPEK